MNLEEYFKKNEVDRREWVRTHEFSSDELLDKMLKHFEGHTEGLRSPPMPEWSFVEADQSRAAHECLWLLMHGMGKESAKGVIQGALSRRKLPPYLGHF